MSKILCDVYKSSKKAETYIYVTRQDGMERVPKALLDMFGKPQLTLTFILTATKKLAQVDAEKLISELKEKGFYLQLPPLEETAKIDLFTKLDKE